MQLLRLLRRRLLVLLLLIQNAIQQVLQRLLLLLLLLLLFLGLVLIGLGHSICALLFLLAGDLSQNSANRILPSLPLLSAQN